MIAIERVPVPVPRLEKIMKEKRVVLALGGGAARGCSHIGVLSALRDLGIVVEGIAGTSIGAMVGAIYCAGRIDDLESFFLEMDWKRLLQFCDVVFPHSGLIDGKHILEFLRPYVGDRQVQDLDISFLAVTSDLETGEEVLLDEGDLAGAIRSSIAVPGLLTPIRRDGRLLVDGGLVDPVPVGPARRLSPVPVIAVELNRYVMGSRAGRSPSEEIRPRRRLPAPPEEVSRLISRFDEWLAGNGHRQISQILKKDPTPGIPDVLSFSTIIMQNVITDAHLALDPPELLISPQVGGMGFLAFDKAEEAIRAGYDATMEALGSGLSDCRV